MISTRNDMLAAVRVAQPDANGLTIGPCAFADGQHIQFGKVIDKESKARLLDLIKRAPSRVFNNVQWGLPNVRKEQARKSRKR